MRAILTWHSIDDSGSVISTAPADLRRQLEWLARSDVEVLDLEALFAAGGPRDAVALTFDDAFENFETTAWPILSDLGLPATMFVPSGHVGKTNGWERGGRLPELPILRWQAIARLADEGLVLGSHSATHPDLRGLDDGALRGEIVDAADRIRNETGREPRGFAYPYGSVDERVAGFVREHHVFAVTTEFRILGEHETPWRVPRLDAYYFRLAGRLEAFGSDGFGRFVDRRRRLRKARRFFSRD
jgi:peptidoglycan/xylan/chitin deacetylase (PgdA/CDA1 family)